jgi:two-component system response regulator VicR
MSAPATQRETVMVVDDEPEITEVVASALEDDGFNVEKASDGRRALELVERHPPDAMVLDLNLPKVDGLQVVQRCRANPATRDVPIIIVSGSRDALQEIDLQSLVFVEKPFDLEVLLVLIEDAVSSPL